MKFQVGTFNLLADGLCEQEFFSVNSVKANINSEGVTESKEILSEDCDRFIRWAAREENVLNVLTEMFERGECSLVVTQENDHFFYLLKKLRMRLNFPVGGVYGRNYLESEKKHSTSFKIWSKRTPSPQRSFLEECGQFAAIACQFYGSDPDDPYISDDGIGLYFRTDQLRLLDVSSPLGLSSPTILSSIEDQIFLLNSPHCVKCNFQVLDLPSLASIQVYGAHLSSGEDVGKEIERYYQLKPILDQAVKDTFPVIVMDSNNSVNYERQYPAPGSLVTVSGKGKEPKEAVFPGPLSLLIQQHNMTDLVARQRGNECLKMRNRLTNQVSKAFQLMFDTIDKILIPTSVSFLNDETYQTKISYRRYSLNDYNFFQQLRTHEEKRSSFYCFCRDRVFVTCPSLAFDLSDTDESRPPSDEDQSNYRPLLQLYPNQFACSDHPPIIATILFSPPLASF